MIWLVVVALAVAGVVWLWPRPTPLKPPYGPYSERFEALNPHSEPRFSEIMEAIRLEDETELRRLDATNLELEDARIALNAMQSLRILRQRADESLGDDFTYMYVDGKLVIASTRSGTATDSTVIVISHSDSELMEMHEAIGNQVREREIAEAQVELPQGARTVRVCAEENSGLDLSDYPDTAVVWTGSCP